MLRRRYWLNFGALVLASLFARPAGAQVFQGLVLDDSTKKPIPRYPVRLLRQYRSSESVVAQSRTDVRGMFQLLGREAGVYRLEFGDSLSDVSYGPVDTVSADTVLIRQFAVRLPSEMPERPFLEFEVDKPAQPMPGSGSPRYPEKLRSGGVCGEVLTSFVVDTAGRVEMKTFRVLQSTDPQFADAVRAAAPRMRFLAAVWRGQKVRQQLQHPFSFAVVPTNGPCPTSLPSSPRCPGDPSSADSVSGRPGCRPPD